MTGEVRESRTFSSDMERVHVLSADKKKSGFWERDWPIGLHVIIIVLCI